MMEELEAEQQLQEPTLAPAAHEFANAEMEEGEPEDGTDRLGGRSSQLQGGGVVTSPHPSVDLLPFKLDVEDSKMEAVHEMKLPIQAQNRDGKGEMILTTGWPVETLQGGTSLKVLLKKWDGSFESRTLPNFV